MAWTLGDVFTKIGHISAALDAILAPAQSAVPSAIDTIAGDYLDTDHVDLINNIYTSLASYRANPGNSFLAYLQRLAAALVVQDVAVAESLPQRTTVAALAQLIAAMTANGQTVQSNTVGVTVTPAGGNVGSPAFVVSLAGRRGVMAENALAETIHISTITDSNTGTARSGGERLFFAGRPAVSRLAWNWPAGSGCGGGLTLIDANLNGLFSGSLLANGGLETWTVSNIPDGWAYDVGAAGVVFFKSTSQHYDGATSLRIVGDGTTLSATHQTLAIPPVSAQQYALGFWAKVDVVPAAGVLEGSLTDSAGTVLTDASGADSKFTVNLPGLTTGWIFTGGVLRTPVVVPGMARLRLRLTTPLSAGSDLFLDRIALTPLTSLYAGGPALAGFSGVTPTLAGDQWTLTVTNDRAGTYQNQFDQLFNMKQLGLVLPGSNSPTIT